MYHHVLYQGGSTSIYWHLLSFFSLIHLCILMFYTRFTSFPFNDRNLSYIVHYHKMMVSSLFSLFEKKHFFQVFWIIPSSSEHEMGSPEKEGKSTRVEFCIKFLRHSTLHKTKNEIHNIQHRPLTSVRNSSEEPGQLPVIWTNSLSLYLNTGIQQSSLFWIFITIQDKRELLSLLLVQLNYLCIIPKRLESTVSRKNKLI